jgi:chromatin remodeling complex protein RSC6
MDSYMKKMAERIAEVNLSLNEMKVAQDKYRESVKKLNHVYEMMVKKDQKQANKPKKERKACGFAVAVPVSDIMCEFMEVEKGSLVARTDITKRLNAYIKANGLENPENRQQILPDERLWKILGVASPSVPKEGRSDEDANVVITHFNIQKYINGHFLKKTVGEPLEVQRTVGTEGTLDDKKHDV